MANLEEKSSHFVSLIVMAKAFLLGLFTGWLYFSSLAVYLKLDKTIQALDYRQVFFVSILLLGILLLSVYLKKQVTLLKSVLMSKRIDLLLFLALGIVTVFSFETSTTTVITKIMGLLSVQQLFVLFFVTYAFIVVPSLYLWLCRLFITRE